MFVIRNFLVLVDLGGRKKQPQRMLQLTSLMQRLVVAKYWGDDFYKVSRHFSHNFSHYY